MTDDLSHEELLERHEGNLRSIGHLSGETACRAHREIESERAEILRRMQSADALTEADDLAEIIEGCVTWLEKFANSPERRLSIWGCCCIKSRH